MYNNENICLLIHAIKDPHNSQKQQYCHPNLFLELKDIEDMILSIKERGYEFKLPHEIDPMRSGQCAITFDDGYQNNIYFLSIAQKYQIPFIIFVNSYYIETHRPFPWDINQIFPESINLDKSSYISQLNNLPKEKLKFDNAHRPFTVEELQNLSKNPLVFFANHTAGHTPIKNRFRYDNLAEIDDCSQFLSKFQNHLEYEFALPNGIYQMAILKNIKQRFKRIYTIRGGAMEGHNGIIHRISLISTCNYKKPKLIHQIVDSFSTKRWLTRKYNHLRASYF